MNDDDERDERWYRQVRRQPDPRNAVGARVELIECYDEHTRLEPGEEGTVRLVDAWGTVFVDWDSGSTLGLIPGVDEWTVLDAEA